MSVEDTASQSSVIFESRYTPWLKDTISGVHVNVSPGSAETLVKRSGIPNQHLIAYSLSNISAKNCHNQLMCVEIIVCNISVVFWDIVYNYLQSCFCGPSISATAEQPQPRLEGSRRRIRSKFGTAWSTLQTDSQNSCSSINKQRVNYMMPSWLQHA